MSRPTPLLFSEACERNKQPILTILQQVLREDDRVLEIGSGTGQHACYFAEQLPQITWQPTDRPSDPQNWQSLQDRINNSQRANLLPPLPLDVATAHTAEMLAIHSDYSAAFTANTLHIMPWPAVEKLFDLLGRYLLKSSKFLIYGPFNYDNHFTSDSNRQFDGWLKSRDSAMGIRDIEAVVQLAEHNHFRLVADHAMPANNRLLHLRHT